MPAWGITMIYVTHDQVEAMTLADRIAIMDRARIVQLGPRTRCTIVRLRPLWRPSWVTRA
jgi:ABC-type Fe3+/spermidine/putrescine transport system ATPase subunit